MSADLAIIITGTAMLHRPRGRQEAPGVRQVRPRSKAIIDTAVDVRLEVRTIHDLYAGTRG